MGDGEQHQDAALGINRTAQRGFADDAQWSVIGKRLRISYRGEIRYGIPQFGRPRREISAIPLRPVRERDDEMGDARSAR